MAIRNDIYVLLIQSLAYQSKYEWATDFLEELKLFNWEYEVEIAKIQYNMGQVLFKQLKFHEAEAEYRAVIEKTFKEIVEVEIYKWAWKAYERLANLYYD